MTQTIAHLQQQLQHMQTVQQEVEALQDECRTAELHIKELEKQNADLQSSQSKLSSVSREQHSWKEQYDALYEKHQALVEEMNATSQERDAQHSQELDDLRQRLKSQLELIQSIREEKEEAATQFTEQMATKNQTLESLQRKVQQLSEQLKQRPQERAMVQPPTMAIDEEQEVKDIPTSSSENPSSSSSHAASEQERNGFFFYDQVKGLQGEELQQLQKRVLELQEEAEEARTHADLYEKQTHVLKEEIRNQERAKTRENANLEYLKNIIVKYMETDDLEVSAASSLLFPSLPSLLTPLSLVGSSPCDFNHFAIQSGRDETCAGRQEVECIQHRLMETLEINSLIGIHHRPQRGAILHWLRNPVLLV